MKNLSRLSLAEMKEFVEGNRSVGFELARGQQAYPHVEEVLAFHEYPKLSKLQKGVVKAYLEKITGLSRAQLARLIQRWRRTRRVRRKPARRPRLRRRYTAADVAVLAEVDTVHEELSGPAVKHLLERGFDVEGNAAFERLKDISVSHIYNLRKGDGYRKLRVRVEHTKSRKVNIGERRRPDPKGEPGYIRVDTVHQGHHDGKAGVYHINAVDTVTQWEVLGCVETISELHLIPVLEAMLHQFPFRIVGFHSDNGSEYINGSVAKMLNRLLVTEFTKSRANRSTDNAQVEGKNGAVVRKLIGYGPIPSEHAEELQKFYTANLNPYLNFHRPCGYATIRVDRKGKRKKIYRPQDYRTPYEKLVSIKGWEKRLKPSITPELLKRQAHAFTDTEAARRMSQGKAALLAKYRKVRGFAVNPRPDEDTQ
jgi:hypothetical protein